MRIIPKRVQLCSSCLLLSFATLIVAGDKKKDEAAKPTADVEVEKDRYEVPRDDVKALVKFIDDMRNFRPTTADDFLQHRNRAPKAIEVAARRILVLEEDKTSKSAKVARNLLLIFRIQNLAIAPPDEQVEVYGEVREYLASLDKLTRNELGIAVTTANKLERHGNKKLAAAAFQTFGDLFAKQEDEDLSSYGQKMLGAARRANLIGNEMQIDGQTIDGETFDWSIYRGKVVLVDFWATWCGPCVEELPNVKMNYELYNERGFEVVGISLDTNRSRLEHFIAERELPWVTLFNDGADRDHPIASYYGVMEIPSVMLVNQEGRVVSLQARGPELGRQLEALLGPPELASDDGE
jgi:peroxiredoxin